MLPQVAQPFAVWAWRSPRMAFPRAGAALSHFSKELRLVQMFPMYTEPAPHPHPGLLCWPVALLTAWPHPLVPAETGREAEVKAATGCFILSGGCL